MKFLEKYLLLLFLIVNITAEYKAFASISKAMFYVVLALSIPTILINLSTIIKIRKIFAPLFIMISIYIIAQFIFQINMLSLPNLLYTISKCAVLSIMAISISKNYMFYFQTVVNIFPYLILFLILMGWVYNRVDFTGMVSFGFVNRNVACTLATAGFAGFMFRSEHIRLFDLLSMGLLFLTILYGGSRNALAMCILIIMIRYGFSYKVVIAAIVCGIFILYLVPLLGVETTAFERLVGTFDGTTSLDREEQREQAWRMIEAKPWTGWGYSYNTSEAALLTDCNAHNGYLTTIENLGWPCGIALLGTIVIGSFRLLKLYFKKNRFVNYHLAIIISTLFGTMHEDYLVGVNQCTTNLFFVSFAVLGAYIYTKKNIIQR